MDQISPYDMQGKCRLPTSTQRQTTGMCQTFPHRAALAGHEPHIRQTYRTHVAGISGVSPTHADDLSLNDISNAVVSLVSTTRDQSRQSSHTSGTPDQASRLT
jgi:hypothetical protein